MKKYKPGILVLSLVICFLPGVIGSFFTAGSVDTWYITLNKPAFNPPSWVFGPVWSVLYVMMGISFYLILLKREAHNIKSAVVVFSVQLILNGLWSIIFFGLREIKIALTEIIILWAAILICILLFKRISKTASALLIPYLLWVSFAAILNYEIMELN